MKQTYPKGYSYTPPLLSKKVLDSPTNRPKVSPKEEMKKLAIQINILTKNLKRLEERVDNYHLEF